jgi:hypothetical protein
LAQTTPWSARQWENNPRPDIHLDDKILNNIGVEEEQAQCEH